MLICAVSYQYYVILVRGGFQILLTHCLRVAQKCYEAQFLQQCYLTSLVQDYCYMHSPNCRS